MKTNNKDNKAWRDSFSGRITIGVISGVILIFAGFWIKKHILTEPPQQQVSPQSPQLKQSVQNQTSLPLLSRSKKNTMTSKTEDTSSGVPAPENKQTPLQTSINATDSNVLVGPASNVTQNIFHEPIQRLILPDKIPLLKAELSKHRNESIEITCVMGDQEAFSFASQLKSIFESAGWSVNGVNQAVYSAPIKGVIIIVKDKAVEPKANFIFQLLQVSGFPSHGELNDKMTNDIGLIIGSK